ncbi:Zinc finger CCHC-type [Arabidopsis suecica]|uniref:Zinc finger CCHC-type n=1 Tax=Arabidopsis suecica TaxID=45249 RepID=A0A8T2BQU7_ARASU|nr:Zinc finger CCHC-type [Arabidopsis suecica]
MKMSEDKTLTKIPHFDGHYDQWSELMESLWRAKGLWSLVEEGYSEGAAGAEVTAVQRKQLDDLKMKDNQKLKKNSYEEEDQELNVIGRGGGSFRGRGQGRGRLFNKATIECYRCHKLGHFQYECLNELEENEEVMLVAYVELQETQRGDVLFVDSSCSNHMCGDRSMFSSMDATFTHNVKLGNNHKLEVSGKGVVKIMLKGINYVINDVYYVPELKKNLLSVGQLQEKRLDVLFKGGYRKTCIIFHPTKGKIAESVMSTN